MKKSTRRGYVPTDQSEFSQKELSRLNIAAQEVFYLVNRGYPMKSAITFVGNHHLLSLRQRQTIQRGVASYRELALRENKRIIRPENDMVIAIDAFNTIITLEVATSHSLLIEGMDGCIRDLAGLRGTYQVVDKTTAAVEYILKALDDLRIGQAIFYLDAPVSNSGRLAGLINQLADRYQVGVFTEVTSQVDQILRNTKAVVTSDSIVLNACQSWFNLNSYIIKKHLPPSPDDIYVKFVQYQDIRSLDDDPYLVIQMIQRE